MKNNKKKKGFTLVELIAVIAILGILAAIVVPRLGGYTDTARQRTNDANLTIIQNAVSVFEANTGALPASEANIEGTAYLGHTAPTPRITGAITNTMVFRMDANGVVSIGAPGAGFITLSAVAQ